MAQLFDTTTLQPTEVPDEQAPQAVLSGRYGLPKGQRLVLTRPDGQTVTVPTESAPEAFQKGYTFTSQQPLRKQEVENRFGALGATALEAGAGLARGLTLGLSDRALRNLGVRAKTLRDLDEAAPLLSGGSELVGAIAPMALSGGTGAAAEGAMGAVRTAATTAGAIPALLGRAGTAVGEAAARAAGLKAVGSLAQRALARGVETAASGALEGAVFSAGKLVSEDALGRADLNAESLLAHAGLGAVVGGATGGLLGIGGEMVGTGARKALQTISDKMGKGEGAEGYLSELAAESAIKATGARGADIRKLMSREKIQQIGEDLLNTRLANGDKVIADSGLNTLLDNSTEGIFQRLGKAKDEAGQKLGDFREKVSQITAANPELQINVPELLQKVTDDVIAPLRASKVPADHDLAAKTMAQFDVLMRDVIDHYKATSAPLTTEQLATMSQPEILQHYISTGQPLKMTTGQLEDFRQRLAAHIWPKADLRTGMRIAPDNVQELMKAERTVSDAIEQHTEQAVQAMANAQTAAGAGAAAGSDLYSRAMNIFRSEGAVTKATLQRRLGAGLADVDSVFARAEREGILSPPGAGGVRTLLQEPPSVAAPTASSDLTPGQYAQLKRQYESMAKAWVMTGKADLQNMGNRWLSLTDTGAMLTGLASGEGLDVGRGIITGLLHKLVRERARAVISVVADKASRLGVIQRASQGIEQRIDDSLTKMLAAGPRTNVASPAAVELLPSFRFLPAPAASTPTGSPMRAETEQTAPGRENRKQAAKRLSGELAQLVTDPAGFSERVSRNLQALEGAAPKTAEALAASTAKAVQFLASKAPKNPTGVNTLQPLLDDWMPSEEDAARFERYLRAATNPLSTLDDLARGTLTKEAAETLRELYPQLHQLTVTRLQEKLADSKERLPYVDRVNLSVLLGVPVDETMRPDFLRRSQAVWAAKPTAGQGAGGQRMAALGRNGIAKSMQSPSDAAVARLMQ